MMQFMVFGNLTQEVVRNVRNVHRDAENLAQETVRGVEN